MIKRQSLEQSIFSLTDLATYIAFAGIAYKFFTAVRQHFSGSTSDMRYDLLTFVMPLVLVAAVFLLLKDRKIPNSFFGWGIGFSIYAVLVTVINGGYAAFNLVFVIINMTYWLVIAYVMYRYKRKYPQKQWLVSLSAVLLVLCFLSFLLSVNTAGQDSYYEERDLLSNSVYFLLFLLPMAMLVRKVWLRNVCVALIFVAAVISNKRGALVVLVLSLLVWMFLQMRGKSGIQKIGMLFLCVIVAGLLYALFNVLVTELELPILERFQSFFEGNDTGSGRGEIWADTFAVLGKENMVYTLLGRGYRAVSIFPTYSSLSESHNDMLQVLFDYGVIGLLLLFGIYKSLIGMAVDMYKQNYRYATPFIVSLIVFLCCAMISQVLIYPYWFLGVALFWGYTMADFQNQREKVA